MKNKLLIMILLLPIWMGCIYDFPADCEDLDVNSGTTYMGLRSSQIILPSDSEGEVESITIESLRILIFSQGTGSIVTNEMFDVANLPVAVQDQETGEWSVDFSNIVVKTRPGPSIVYVVLNENIMDISGQTLTGALNMVSSVTEMETLMNTPLSYTTPLMVTYDTEGKPVEPPFIMSTFGECIILPGKTEEDPNIADLTGNGQGFELDRTMAKVTIESVSSYPIEGVGAPTTDNVETSYIFILKMGLTNVPMQYLWSPNRPLTNGYPAPVYSGDYQNIDFALEDDSLGYYDRDWGGDITVNIHAYAYKVESKDARIWYTGAGSGINAYSLSKDALDAYILEKGINTNNAYYDSYNGADPPLLILNSGNWLSFVQDLFLDNNYPFLPTYYQLIEPYDLNPVVTGGYWELKKKNISYYIPEHILESSNTPSQSTKLHIKAVKAQLPDTISKEESTDISWNSETWGEWIYAVSPGEVVDQNAINSLWGFERDTILYNGLEYPIIRHYWSSGIRYAYGHAMGTLSGVQFQNITNSSDIKDFYLPIRNTPADPEDYNIYRNHEYRFSVHALEQWDPEPLVSGATNATARSSGPDAPGSMVLRISNE
jgi:hypothetical protein